MTDVNYQYPLGLVRECCICDRNYRVGIDSAQCGHAAPTRRSQIVAKKFWKKIEKAEDESLVILAIARLIDDEREYAVDEEKRKGMEARKPGSCIYCGGTGHFGSEYDGDVYCTCEAGKTLKESES